MALSQKLELRQSQSLVMTPQLMQAIKLLQLSNLDLIAYVEAELERNPILERAEGDDGGDASGDEVGQMADGGDADPSDWLRTKLEPDGAAIASTLDADLANVFPDDHEKPADENTPVLPAESWSTPPSRQPVSSGDYNLEAFVAQQKSLADHLTDQLGLAIGDPTMRLIGRTIINEIDETGYLRTDLATLAERLVAPIDVVERTLATIHSFEPAGVGARDLAECLAIQLRERDRFDPAMATMVANLDLVAKREYAALRRLCGVDEEDLADMLAELKSLDPKPGNAFGGSEVQTVIPDVFVRQGPEGGWHIEHYENAFWIEVDG